MKSNTFYISARKKETNEPWQFVRNRWPNAHFRMDHDPFMHCGEEEVRLYTKKLSQLGYEAIVTKVGSINEDGIYIRELVEGDLSSLVRSTQGENEYTADLHPPRR